MSSLDKNNYRKEQNSYYNINIYNNTTDPILCKYSTSLIAPLLHKPSDFEVCVARASVQLNGIPLSQDNIGFEDWAVQFTNISQNIVQTQYVGQFNPGILYDEQFNLALTNQPLQYEILTTSNQASGSSSSINILLLSMTFEKLEGFEEKSNLN